MTGEELKAIRLSMKLSQDEFAKRLGSAQANISKMERGKLPISHILAIAIFGVQQGLDKKVA